MISRIVISLSGNKPDRMTYITDAIGWLQTVFSDLRTSDIYEMPAINGRDMPYLNTVIEATTTHTVDEVSCLLKKYETSVGRTPRSKIEGIIPIDIDLIIWNDTVIRPREFDREYFTKGYRQLYGC